METIERIMKYWVDAGRDIKEIIHILPRLQVGIEQTQSMIEQLERSEKCY